MTFESTTETSTLAHGNTLNSTRIADLAVKSLCAEADLTPKPGLVDRRGSGAHSDMTRQTLHTSAAALRPAFEQCVTAAQQREVSYKLRAELGVIGRAGEAAMLNATKGVNTHRGALWAIGLLCAGAALSTRDATTEPATIAEIAAQIARIPDPALEENKQPNSHGANARRKYHVVGAAGEARQGFPHIICHALPALEAARVGGADEPTARLEALIALIAHLDDTCILHRGGMPGLRSVQLAARAVIDAGGPRTSLGRRQLSILDHLCAANRWSPGGSGDLLAATLFLDAVKKGAIY
jgi:triphosphoribosyl-dephospho-CoA synthase